MIEREKIASREAFLIKVFGLGVISISFIFILFILFNFVLFTLIFSIKLQGLENRSS